MGCEEQIASNGQEKYGSADDHAVVPSQTSSERRLEPLSDEWFDDLDKSIDEITRLFEEMRMAPPEPEDVGYIQHAEDGLAAMEQDLTKCFTNLETLKRRLGGSRCRNWSASRSSSDDDLFKLFRPRSLDPGPLNRITKPKSRLGHRRSMPPISSPVGEAIMKHLFGWLQPCDRGCVTISHHSFDDMALLKSAEPSEHLIH